MRATFAVLLCLLALSVVAFAQPNRFYDGLTVKFDSPVTVNTNQTLPAGKYKFQQLRMPGQPNIFDVRDSSDKHVALTATAADALYHSASATEVPGQTQIVLKEVGSKRYLDRIWFAGQIHGYDFSLAEDAQNAQGSTMSNNATQSASSASQSGTKMAVAPIREIVVIAVPVSNSSAGMNSENSPASDSSAPSSGTSSQNGSGMSAPAKDQHPSSTSQGNTSSATNDSSATTSTSGGTAGMASSTSDMNTSSSGQQSSAASGDTKLDSSGSQSGTMSNPAGSSTSSSSNAGTAQPTQQSGDTSGSASAGNQDSQNPIQLRGCVTGPYGGSYMLVSSNDGQKYSLIGDYDNMRESLGRVVTVWGVPSTAANATSNNSNSQTSNQQSNPSNNNGSASNGSASSNGNLPVAVTVRSIQRVSEFCDKP